MENMTDGGKMAFSFLVLRVIPVHGGGALYSCVRKAPNVREKTSNFDTFDNWEGIFFHSCVLRYI